jgi:asparagine synthase (glutamine-hydrolysing)
MSERMYNASISFGNVVKERFVAVQVGMWNFDGTPINRTSIEAMSGTIAHCGPDGEEIHVEPNIVMLYRPFHTTPESRRERQPYRLSGNQLITWDGRLDNREMLCVLLRNDLQDTNPTDVALVAAGFQKWGCGVFEKLIGDWASVIWNAHDQELILARDVLGVRHIYFYSDSGSIAWSTHLGSLLTCADRFTLCHEYIASYFTQWPQACLTPYSEIRAVEPATFMIFRPQHTETHKYWEFRPQLRLVYKDDHEYEEHFCALFRQAVRSRLRSDLPILAHLSGGLDSSSIVCMADDILAEEPTTAPRMDTFSFYDLAEPGEEDYKYWTAVEEKRGRGHHAELRASGDTFSVANVASAVIPGFGIREELKTAEHEVIRNGNYRVVLSGAGGDQMLGQTIDPAAPIADLLVRLQLRSALRELIAWSLKTRRPLVQILAQSLALLFPTRLRAHFTPARGLQPWLAAQFADKYRIIDRLLPAGEGRWHRSPSSRAFDQAVKECTGLVASTPPAMEEVRYPFLDRRLVEFLAAIPTGQLMRGGERRSIMRRALANIVPKEILSRQSKSSTGRCDVLTLRKHWTKIQEALESPLTAEIGYLDPNNFRKALSAFARGNVPPYDGQLLRGLALEFWLKDKLAEGLITIPAL